MRINSLHYFRAIAILLIVAGHSYAFWYVDTLGEKILANLITGGSALFVFISGFLFHHLNARQFAYARFIGQKIKYVLVPYLILSVAGLLLFTAYPGTDPSSPALAASWVAGWTEYLALAARHLWTGELFTAYWYVPFIMIIFFLAPLFVWQTTLSRGTQLAIFVSFLGLALLARRPTGNFSPVHSVIYYLPAYLAGIMCSAERVRLFEFLENKTVALGVGVFALAVGQAILEPRFGNFHKNDIFSFAGLDIILIQKLVLCLFLLSLLNRYEQRHMPSLNYLATLSFAIYFLHPWVLVLLKRSGVLNAAQVLPGFLSFVLTAPTVLALSILLAQLIKLGLKNRSRFLIGW